MDFSLTPDQETFRQTLRAWLKGNIPREWKHVGSSEIPRVEAYDLLKRWQNSLFDAQQVEHSAERPRAEEAPVAPLLVAPRGDGERQPVHALRLADRL